MGRENSGRLPDSVEPRRPRAWRGHMPPSPRLRQQLTVGRRFDALGQMPAGLRELRTLKHGERSFQPDGARNVRAFEQVLERLQRVGAQIAQIVIQSCNVFAAGILDGGLELRLGAEPVMNGSSVNTGLSARGA